MGSGFPTLLRKELTRFWKVGFQTIAAPVLTAPPERLAPRPGAARPRRGAGGRVGAQAHRAADEPGAEDRGAGVHAAARHRPPAEARALTTADGG